MFPRRKRLSRTIFPTILATGRRVSSPHFSVIISKETTGYAVVVPKKIARLSVTRHRIKRQILAVLRAISPPLALIIFPKSSISSVNYQDLKEEITNLISKVH